MNFFLDQDVPETVCRVLRAAGHHVLLLRDFLPVEATDLGVLEYASERELVLVSCNRDDFLSLTETRPHAGLIILIRRKTRVAECAALFRLLTRAGEAGIRNNVNFA
jgi:predicted nuclease of predicted toxin-antitoxin system